MALALHKISYDLGSRRRGGLPGSVFGPRQKLAYLYVRRPQRRLTVYSEQPTCAYLLQHLHIGTFDSMLVNIGCHQDSLYPRKWQIGERVLMDRSQDV